METINRIGWNKSDEKRVLNIYLIDGCFTLIFIALSKRFNKEL